MVSEILLASHKCGEELAGPYIPTFYQYFKNDSIAYCDSSDVKTQMGGGLWGQGFMGGGGGGGAVILSSSLQLNAQQ